MTFGRNMPLPIPMCEVPFGANVSPDPQPAPPPDARRLLSSVADALNACEAAGVSVKLKHGAVMTPLGYVLPLGEGAWGARTLAWTEFSAQAAGDDEDLASAFRVRLAAPPPMLMPGEGFGGGQAVEHHPRRHLPGELERGFKVEPVLG